MDPEEFRRYGHAVVDWVADYWALVEQRPVAPADPPGTVAAALPAAPPETAASRSRRSSPTWTAIVVPGLTHWQHPAFFAYFPANTSGPSRARRPGLRRPRRAGHALGHRPGLHRAGDGDAGLAGRAARPAGRGSAPPAPAAGSSRTPRPRRRWWPRSPRCTGPAAGRWRDDGHRPAGTRVYTSTQGHSSIEKAARIAGLGDDGVRLVEVDPDTLALRPEALRAAIEADLAAG